MLLKKTFKFRLRPSVLQRAEFCRFAGARRWIYNRGLEQRKTAWEQEQRRISLFDQNRELTALKNQTETAWLKEMHSQVLQQALHDLDRAYSNFFRRLQNQPGRNPGYPRFKSRGENDSFRYPQGVKLSQDKVWLPKIGWVTFYKSREVVGTIKQTTIIQEGSHWYLCLSCEMEQEVLPVPIKNVAGIDLGLEKFATIASGENEEMVANPRFFKWALAKLRFLGRQVSKKKLRSNNRRRAKERLSRFHARVRNRRRDFLHQISTRLVKNHDALVVEGLGVAAMLQHGVRRMARAISDAGWRQFLQMLAYKCLHNGKKIIELDQYFPSSQICSRCGAKQRMTLKDRVYECACGLAIDRDVNAARVLRAAGMSVLEACGAAS